MTPQEAYDAISALLGGGTRGPLGAAWHALDAALQGNGALPAQWERLTSRAAADRAGKSDGHWGALVGQGYAPLPDGRDTSGRAFWHPATVDAWLTGEWRHTPRQRDPGLPPRLNADGETWRVWARGQGLTDVAPRAPRETVITLCRAAGLL